MFQDYLLFATDVQTQYAFRVAHLSHLAQQAMLRHKLSGKPALLLADALTSGVLLASVLETEERVNLRIQCGSDFTLACETSCHAQTRGYLEAAPDSEVMAALGRNEPIAPTVTVRTLRSLPGTNRLVEGITQCVFSGVQEALNDHLKHSFQAGLRLKVTSWFEDGTGTSPESLRSFGVIYLELPGLDPMVEKRLHNHVDSFKGFQQLGNLADNPDALVHELVPDLVRPVNSIQPVWQCTCSLANVESMLLSLQHHELASMAASKEPAEINCHYCATTYRIEPERLQALSLSASAPGSHPMPPKTH
jgi:molecular chaperone Hsp33